MIFLFIFMAHRISIFCAHCYSSFLELSSSFWNRNRVIPWCMFKVWIISFSFLLKRKELMRILQICWCMTMLEYHSLSSYQQSVVCNFLQWTFLAWNGWYYLMHMSFKHCYSPYSWETCAYAHRPMKYQFLHKYWGHLLACFVSLELYLTQPTTKRNWNLTLVTSYIWYVSQSRPFICTQIFQWFLSNYV